MQIILDQNEAIRMFDIWYVELSDNDERSAAENITIRSVEHGNIKLDSTPSTPGARHEMDGSPVVVVYKTDPHSTATSRAVREASVATRIMRQPRSLYTGKLIDIMRNVHGDVYFKIRTGDRRDERNSNAPAFRNMNPTNGTLIKLVINPEMDTIARLGREVG